VEQRSSYEGGGAKLTYIFDITADYKTQFATAVSALISAMISPRSDRITDVRALTDAYVRDIGETPEGRQLERLSDAILNEELADLDPYKIEHNEYPFMSEWQFDLRRGRETSLKGAEEYGTDGTNHAKPIKRRRTPAEQSFMDAEARGNNRRRSAQYKRDTSASPLVTYNLRETGGELTAEYVDRVGLGAAWAESTGYVATKYSADPRSLSV
jgi:hypothetical protein